jgi:hypothetical protein
MYVLLVLSFKTNTMPLLLYAIGLGPVLVSGLFQFVEYFGKQWYRFKLDGSRG